jgi:hypothetical protein
MNTWTCSVSRNDNKAKHKQFDANDVIIITAPLRLFKK